MKTLIINSFFSPLGGAEIIAYNQFKILQAKGDDVFFWATDYKPYFEEDYIYKNYFTKYNGGSLNYLKNPIKYYYNLKARKDLQLFIEKIKPDVIHLHNIFGLTYSILQCCKNIPTVMTIHDAGFVCPGINLLKNNKTYCKDMLCKKQNYFNCIKNKCFNNSYEASIRHSLLLSINHSQHKYIDKFITPSKALKDVILKANIGINENNIITINNFLSNTEFGNVLPNYENKGYFLYVGRLSREKGIHYLLEAMKNLPKDIELHIVGTGKEKNNLKQYAKENNLDNVKFLGFKNREEIKEEYQNCIATILPCNWFEIFGMTNIESFINGKPVIASNIGAIPEIVEHGMTGLLFEPTNVEQLKECIMKYWNNSNLVIEHGKNAYEKAKKQYTEERYYNQLIKLYEETVSEYKK